MLDDVSLPDNSVDFVFCKGMDPYCVGTAYDKPEGTKDFTRSIHRALNKNGLLYIANDAITERYADKHLPGLINLVKKAGPFTLIYEVQKQNEYVLIFKKV